MQEKQKQLGWNCFDIAVGLKREDLVKYALDNSRSLEFRQILAPEIRHAATLAAIYMNRQAEQTEENNIKLIHLFEFVEAGALDPKVANKEIDKLLSSKNAALDQYALPIGMQNQVLRDLVNRYGSAYENMRPIVSEVNDMLARPEGKRLSIAELDEFFARSDNQMIYHKAYEIYIKARTELLTGIESEFLQYSESEETFRQYINTYYAQNGWVAFQRQFAGERSTSMVEIAARMSNITIVILQATDNGLIEIYRTNNFSQTEKRIVFNGINHFVSYDEYMKEQQAKDKNPVANNNSNIDELALILSKTTLSNQITIEKLIDKIRRLINDFERKDLPKKSLSFRLKKDYDEIHHYFEHPELVLRGSYQGGLQRIRELYAAELLRISLFVSRSIKVTKEEAKQVNKGFNHLARLYKVRRAYNELYKGSKFIKAGLGNFNVHRPISQDNPILFRSKENIRNLVSQLKALGGNQNNKYGLRDDEVNLFNILSKNLPYRLQHATNHYYAALSAGSLDSYTELKRHKPEYDSPFSTKGNIDKLGNGGFVFFRVYVDPINGNQTRYGDSALIFDLNILNKVGWVSLHDQLNPFPSKSVATRHLYWNKRLIRTSSVYALPGQAKSDKGVYAGLEYTYRTSKISSYSSGKKDTLKSFGEDIKTRSRQVKFISEIFYGPDILIGIALSVIRELRFLEVCGFREAILQAIARASISQRNQILGELLKGLFRIEGKYPVALRLRHDVGNRTQFFIPILPTDKRTKKDREYKVSNPDGDGRYLLDMSINNVAMNVATAREQQKYCSERVSIVRQHRARYEEGTAEYQRWNTELTQIQAKLEQANHILGDDLEHRRELIDGFVETYEIDENIFDKIATPKLDFINETFSELLEEEFVILEDLLKLSLLQLRLLSEEKILDLIIDGTVSFDEFAECTVEELEAFIQYDIGYAIIERDVTIAELRRLYAENPDHLIYITCDDLDELVLQEAPDVPELLMEYARENDVDFDWILDELCESEQQIFRAKLGLDIDEDQDSEHNEYDDENDNYDEEPEEINSSDHTYDNRYAADGLENDETTNEQSPEGSPPPRPSIK
jgi:hypothetical protein